VVAAEKAKGNKSQDREENYETYLSIPDICSLEDISDIEPNSQRTPANPKRFTRPKLNSPIGKIS